MVKPLLITGMHRSHTSLICQWVNKCGLSFGNQLMAGDFANQEGYFEDLEIVKLHNSLLQEAGVHVYPRKDPDFSNLNFNEASRSLQTIVNKRDEFLGIKDPRACLFLEKLWLKTFPNLNIVFTYRKPSAVIDSLIRREENLYKKQPFIKKTIHSAKWVITKQKWIDRFAAAYVTYNKNILAFAQKHPDNCILIDFDLCMNEGEPIINWIQEKGFQLESIPFEKVVKPSISSNYLGDSFTTKEQELEIVYNHLCELKFTS